MILSGRSKFSVFRRLDDAKLFERQCSIIEMTLFALPSNSVWALLPAVPLDSLRLENAPEALRPRFDTLMLETDFLEATTMRDQVGFACHYLTLLDGQDNVSFRDVLWHQPRPHLQSHSGL
jgi:hypothetical protein